MVMRKIDVNVEDATKFTTVTDGHHEEALSRVPSSRVRSRN